MPAQRFRKIPVEVDAIHYDGTNHAEIDDFTGGGFRFVEPEDRDDDPDVTAVVFDRLHSTWVGVKDGHWIVRGVAGEYYPIDPDVMARTYEAA